jgi:hypothetical protein
LIELGQVILDQSHFFTRQLQEPAIHRVQRRARSEGVAQLSGPSHGSASAAASVSPPARACRMQGDFTIELLNRSLVVREALNPGRSTRGNYSSAQRRSRL